MDAEDLAQDWKERCIWHSLNLFKRHSESDLVVSVVRACSLIDDSHDVLVWFVVSPLLTRMMNDGKESSS